MSKASLKWGESLFLGTAAAREDLAKNMRGRRIEVEACVAAQNQVSAGGVARLYAMNTEAFDVFREDNVSAAKICSARGRYHDIVSVEKIGAHALSVHPELHGIATAKKRGRKFRKKPGIFTDLGITRTHSERPPLRFVSE
ncbi:MAG: hypothetical protein WBL63_08135 [Candidatus Acidiferrum sp.]